MVDVAWLALLYAFSPSLRCSAARSLLRLRSRGGSETSTGKGSNLKGCWMLANDGKLIANYD